MMILPRVIGVAIATLSATVSRNATCDDLHHCRTIPSVIFSCMSTIFLCTWVSVHPNVPEEVEHLQGAWWKRLFKWQGFRETALTWIDELPTRRIMLMIPALLAPEAILTWAFFQWITCCKNLKLTLENNPTCTWTETHSMLANMKGLERISEDGQNRYRYNALPWRYGSVPMPSEPQVRDRGKGDNVSKTITLIQTLWFAIQAAHRVSQGFDVTELELTTLGHVVLNALVYWCWWNKPLCVEFPVEVREEKVAVAVAEVEAENGEVTEQPSKEAADIKGQEESRAPGRPSIRVKIGAYIKERTENFRESEGRRERWFLAGLGCIIGGLFGMVHCLAWNSTFPTHAEQSLWRACALIVTLTPGLGIVIFFFLVRLNVYLLEDILIVVEIALGVAYCASRIGLLVLALMALRDLPYSALESPSWSIYIPHIA